VGAKTHLLRETMNTLEARFDPESFLRIHRSIIVHIPRIASIRPLVNGGCEVHLSDGTMLRASRGHRHSIRALMAASTHPADPHEPAKPASSRP